MSFLVKNKEKNKEKYSKWVLINDNLELDEINLSNNSYGSKISRIFKKPDDFSVVFRHNSGLIAIMLSSSAEKVGSFRYLELLCSDGGVVFASITEIMLEWDVISIFYRKPDEK